MITFESLQERSLRHYRTVHIENKRGLKDPSCAICFPPEEASEGFNKFWNWYKTKVPAVSYSEYTLRIFKDLISLEIGEKNLIRDTKLLNLIGSVKYLERPEISIKDISLRIIHQKQNLQKRQKQNRENYLILKTKLKGLYKN